MTNNPAKQRSSYGMFFMLHEYTQNSLYGGSAEWAAVGRVRHSSAQFVQKRECLQGTRATPVRGAIRQTSHMSGVSSVAAAAVTVAVAADDGVEGSASSSS